MRGYCSDDRIPTLEIAAIEAELEQGDCIALDTYASQVSDRVWRLDQAKLLAAIEEGRPVRRDSGAPRHTQQCCHP